MSQATFDAALLPGLPVQMALAWQAALAWWAAENRANAWCDWCCRALAWGEGYLLPAAGRRGQQMRKQNSAPGRLAGVRAVFMRVQHGRRVT